MTCKNNRSNCSCANVQWQAIRQALPYFHPITNTPEEIAKLAARVKVTPQKMQKLIDKINDSAAMPVPD